MVVLPAGDYEQVARGTTAGDIIRLKVLPLPHDWQRHSAHAAVRLLGLCDLRRHAFLTSMVVRQPPLRVCRQTL